MLVSSNVTMQFGSKPLFENISVKFGGGNRYGLIGANGSGKSTFMKILGGDLEPTLGNVSLDPNERIGKLRQDQFAFEAFTVLDTVIMGHGELWEVKQERDRIYALAEMSEEDGYKVADLEVKYGEMDGYSAEARAGELLLGVGIPVEQHRQSHTYQEDITDHIQEGVPHQRSVVGKYPFQYGQESRHQQGSIDCLGSKLPADK